MTPLFWCCSPPFHPSLLSFLPSFLLSFLPPLCSLSSLASIFLPLFFSQFLLFVLIFYFVYIDSTRFVCSSSDHRIDHPQIRLICRAIADHL